MSTIAQGVFTHCSNGDLALSYTCSGPSCVGIGSIADTTCTSENTDLLSCSNGIVCQGPPLFNSTFYLNQNGQLVDQSDYFDFPGYGHFNYVASGSDNGTISGLVVEATNGTSTSSTGISATSVPSVLSTLSKSQQSISTTSVQSPSQTNPIPTATGLGGAILSLGGFVPSPTPTPIPTVSTSTGKSGTNITTSTTPFIVVSASARRFQLSPGSLLITVLLILGTIIPGVLAANIDSTPQDPKSLYIRRDNQDASENAILLPLIPKSPPRPDSVPNNKALTIRNSHSPTTDLVLHPRNFFNNPLKDTIVSIASKIVRNSFKIKDLILSPAQCAAFAGHPWWLDVTQNTLDTVCLLLSQGLTLYKPINNALTTRALGNLAKACTNDVRLLMLRNAAWLVFVAEFSFGVGAVIEFAAFFLAEILCKLLVGAAFVSASAILDLTCHVLAGNGLTSLVPKTSDLLPGSCSSASSSTIVTFTTISTSQTSAAASSSAAQSTSILIDCDGDYDPGDPDEGSECSAASTTATLTPTPAVTSSTPSQTADCDGDSDLGDPAEGSECSASSSAALSSSDSITTPPFSLPTAAVTAAASSFLASNTLDTVTAALSSLPAAAVTTPNILFPSRPLFRNSSSVAGG